MLSATRAPGASSPVSENLVNSAHEKMILIKRLIYIHSRTAISKEMKL